MRSRLTSKFCEKLGLDFNINQKNKVVRVKLNVLYEFVVVIILNECYKSNIPFFLHIQKRKVEKRKVDGY